MQNTRETTSGSLEGMITMIALRESELKAQWKLKMGKWIQQYNQRYTVYKTHTNTTRYKHPNLTMT